jgi:uncharacterized repeat protein (TIGR03943 family)
MRSNMAKLFNSLTLLGVGAVLLSFSLTGRIDAYLHPMFRPVVLVGGILFCFAGAIYLVTKKSRDCCVDGECVHTTKINPLRSLAALGVLVLPLTAGAILSPDQFDAQVVQNRGIVQDVSNLPVKPTIAVTNQGPNPVAPGSLGSDSDETASQPPLPQDSPTPADGNQEDDSSAQYLPKAADGNVALEVTDLLYSQTEESLRKMFTGRTIEVIGQFMPGQTGNQFRIVRMFIVCCAADARPISVAVESKEPPKVADMAWVKVIGKAEFVEEGNRAKVTLRADAVEPTDPPADAMLY